MNRGILQIFILILLGIPNRASAHEMIEGAGDFYNGLLHPFFSLPHLLTVIALGLLLGQQKENKGNLLSMAFLFALILGFVCATFSIGFSTQYPLLACAGVLGFLLVLSRPLRIWLTAPIAIVTGILMGLDFAAEEVESKAALNVGTGISLYFCFLYLTLIGENFSKKNWQQIGLRILGSWIAAIALLALTLKVFEKQ